MRVVLGISGQDLYPSPLTNRGCLCTPFIGHRHIYTRKEYILWIMSWGQTKGGSLLMVTRCLQGGRVRCREQNRYIGRYRGLVSAVPNFFFSPVSKLTEPIPSPSASPYSSVLIVLFKRVNPFLLGPS